METEHQTVQRSNRAIWIVVASLFVGLAVLAVVGLENGEPSIRGRKLTDWLVQADNALQDSPQRVGAEDAVLEIGSGAISKLLQDLVCEPSLSDNVWKLAEDYKLTAVAARFKPQLSTWQRQRLGLLGFQILGTNAASAADELARLDNEIPFYGDRWQLVPKALVSIGRVGQLQLLNRLPTNWVFSGTGSVDSIKRWFRLTALSSQKHIEPELLDELIKMTERDVAAMCNVLGAIRVLEGNDELKRKLLNYAFTYRRTDCLMPAYELLEASPYLIDEYRDRIAASKPKDRDYPEATALRDKLLLKRAKQ